MSASFFLTLTVKKKFWTGFLLHNAIFIDVLRRGGVLSGARRDLLTLCPLCVYASFEVSITIHMGLNNTEVTAIYIHLLKYFTLLLL